MKKHYTYELVDPRNNRVFYVGKGTHKRMYSHYDTVKNGKNLCNAKLGNKLKKLIAENLKPIYKKVFETEIEQDAYNKEIELIEFYGRENLCNLTDGGDGGFLSKEVQQKALLHSQETYRNRLKNDPEFRERIRKYHSAQWTRLNLNGTLKNKGFLGKCHTAETKEKMSISAKKRVGALNSQFGTRWITNNKENKKIKKEELEFWLNKNWIKGRSYNGKK